MFQMRLMAVQKGGQKKRSATLSMQKMSQEIHLPKPKLGRSSLPRLHNRKAISQTIEIEIWKKYSNNPQIFRAALFRHQKNLFVKKSDLIFFESLF